MKVAIQILAYNSGISLKYAIDSAIKQLRSPLFSDNNLFIQIIDNNSTDQETKEIINSYVNSPVTIILEDSNYGFSDGHNRAIKRSVEWGADYIFFMNPDLILEDNTIELLSKKLAQTNNDVYAITPRIYRSLIDQPLNKDILDSTGIIFTKAIRHFDRGSNEPALEKFTEEEIVAGGTGAALMIKSSALEDLCFKIDLSKFELFDSKFFAYREDADLAWRSLRLGLKTLYYPAAECYHQRKVLPSNRNTTDKQINSYGVRNRFLLIANNFSLSNNLNCIPKMIIRNIIVIFGVLLTEQSSLKGLFEAIILLPQAINKNITIKKRARNIRGKKIDISDHLPNSQKKIREWFI